MLFPLLLDFVSSRWMCDIVGSLLRKMTIMNWKRMHSILEPTEILVKNTVLDHMLEMLEKNTRYMMISS